MSVQCERIEVNQTMKSSSAKCMAASLFVITSGFCAWAQAESPAESRALAQSLFDEARKLMERADFARACGKLEESQRLDPGVGTQLNIAHCYEQAGRSASAWAAYLDAEIAAKAAGQTDREAYAHERAQQLAGTLSKLTISLSPEARALAGLTVFKDGHPIGASAFGTALALDPGDHLVEARAPGYQVWSVSVAVEAGRSDELEIPPLHRLPRTVAQPSPPPGNAQRTVGLTLAGTGLVGLAVGGALALDAKSKYDRAVGDLCGTGGCAAPAYEATNAARRQGNWATAAGLFGAAAVAAGIVIWAAAPGRNPGQLDAGPRITAVELGASDLNVQGAF
jgi:serine/threonine-protein kinase